MHFLLLPLGIMGGDGVLATQSLPWYQHVTPGSPQVGEIALLQDDHVVPEMSVQEMQYRYRPRRQPPPTPIDWELPWFRRGWK